jgi:3-carboxy-cis,cis-muconate cycloisomerase
MTNSFLRNGLWGSLFQDQEVARALSAKVMLDHALAFERVWAEALRDSGAVSADAGAQALAAIDGFTPDTSALARASENDGLPVPALIKALKAAATEVARPAIHTGATSQDVLDTAMVLTGLALLDLFRDRTRHLVDGLDGLSERFGSAPMMARTRMQAALPITVADRIEDWRSPLVAHLVAIETLKDALGYVQIGGPVGLRDVPDGVADRVAASLGLRLGPVWHSDRSRMLDLGHLMVKLSGTLGKMGQDIALMAQIGEVGLSGGGGSSAMPHKQNPVRAEVLVALARTVAGHQGTLGQAMVHEQERSGAGWAIEWLTLPTMLEMTGAALNNAETLLAQITRLGPPPAGPDAAT